MSGIDNLAQQLKSLRPVLSDELFVFAHVPTASYGDFQQWSPVAFVLENEGATLVCKADRIENNDLQVSGTFRRISLGVHSTLDSVGLTATVSRVLAEQGISANMIAGYFHDHIYVNSDKAELAVDVLQKLSEDASNNQD